MDQGAEVGILFVDQTIRSTLAHLDEAINFARCKLAGLSAISVPERAERNKYQRRNCVWFGPQPITDSTNLPSWPFMLVKLVAFGRLLPQPLVVLALAAKS